MAEGRKPALETVGERLRRLRLQRGMSQRELSAPGVSYAYISRIEAGARRPSVKALRMLARKLEVSPEYLETGSDIREVDERELRIADAELQLRLEEDPEGVEEALAELLGEALSAGDSVGATRTRIALGLAAARAGHHADAARQLEEVIAAGTVSPLGRPDVYVTLGRAYASLGAHTRAVELFEDCVREVTDQEPEDAAAQVRYVTYLSYALTDSGELDRAQEVLRDVLDRIDRFADPYTRVRLYWSLGRLSSHQGNQVEALDYFRRAIALLEATEDTLHLAGAHVGCASILISSDRAAEAQIHLETAERLLGSHPERSDLAALRHEQARRAVHLGQGDEAVSRARETLELLGDANPVEQGSAYLALAQGFTLSGEIEEADATFRRAVELLEQHGQLRDLGEALRAWGKLLRSTGRENEALDVLERAAELGLPSAPAGARGQR